MSALAFVAAAVLTVRSYLVFDKLVWTTRQTQRSFALNRGRLGFSADAAVNGSVFGDSPGFTHWRFAPVHRVDSKPERWANSYFECLGSGYLRQSTGATDSRNWWVSTWLILAVSGAGPTWLLVNTLRRRRRMAAGSCQCCGYDMRATPERCPECGTSIGTGQTAAR